MEGDYFKSFLTTFEASIIFEAAEVEAKILLFQKNNL